MVEPDARDHRNIPIHDVHRIQTTAETDLKNGVVKRDSRHHYKSGQRRVLEVRKLDVTPARLDGLESIDDGSVISFLAIDADTFVEPVQVWRRRRSDAVARR